MNLIDAIDTEIGTPPPLSFDVDTLIQHELHRRTRVRRIAIGAGAVVSAALAATVVFASLATHSTAEPTVSTPATPSATPFPLPTQSWPALPLPTGVPSSFDVTLARIGPSLGVPAGTRFVYTDLGGYQKVVQTKGWGPSDSWGNIAVDPIESAGCPSGTCVDKKVYSCAQVINCIEVTGSDGSMTYVGGPIVAPGPPDTPSFNYPPPSFAPQPSARSSVPNDFVYSYHSDGTLVMILIVAAHAPDTLTIAQLVAAGQAFSLVS